MTELYLHIGHGKTGSTYLQNALLKSADDLAKIGSIYPVQDQLRRRVERNDARINSGNGWELLTLTPDDLAKRHAGADKLILSSEILYDAILKGQFGRDTLTQMTEVFDKVHVLLFVRDPMEMAAALYQQAVKRHGAIRPFADAAMNTSYQVTLSTVLTRLEGIPRLHLTVHNYSRVRKSLIAVTEAWLGLNRGFLTVPDTATVNRSLTPGEIRIQLVLNRLLGRSGPWFADRMCMWFPNRKVPPYVPSQKILDRYRKVAAAATDAVNARLPDEARLQIG